MPLRLVIYCRNLAVGIAVETCDRILLSKSTSKVSESFYRMWIESEFRQSSDSRWPTLFFWKTIPEEVLFHFVIWNYSLTLVLCFDGMACQHVRNDNNDISNHKVEYNLFRNFFGKLNNEELLSLTLRLAFISKLC